MVGFVVRSAPAPLTAAMDGNLAAARPEPTPSILGVSIVLDLDFDQLHSE